MAATRKKCWRRSDRRLAAAVNEVDDKVLTAGAKYRECFTLKPNGKYQLDLWLMNRLQLEAAGLERGNIHCAATCTCDNRELFFPIVPSLGKTGRMGVSILPKIKKE